MSFTRSVSLFALFLLGAVTAHAQYASSPFTGTSSAPSGSCTSNTGKLVSPTGKIYTCQNGTWAQVSGGGGGGAVGAPGTVQIVGSTPGTFAAGNFYYTNPTATGMTGYLIGNAQEPDLSCCNGAGNSISFISNNNGSPVENHVTANPNTGYYQQSFYQAQGSVSSPANLNNGQNIAEQDFLGYRGGQYVYLITFLAKVGANGGGEFNVGAQDDSNVEQINWSINSMRKSLGVGTSGDPLIGITPLSAASGEFNNGTAVANGGSLASLSFLRTQVKPVGVASLGTCNAAAEGTHAAVTDSNAVSFTAGIGAVVAGGGSTHVPVYCDGTNWRIG